MNLGGSSKRRKLIWSMVSLVVVVLAAGAATNVIYGLFKSRDPIYQCIQDPEKQAYQVAVPITVTQDGAPSSVPAGIGITKDCTRPVHTLKENEIHVAYSSPYNFTLGHFLYIWGIDLSKVQTKVYVNGTLYSQGSILDLVLKNGQTIRIDFSKR